MKSEECRVSPETKTVKRITRNRRLTSEEAAEYKAVRKQVAEELPELIVRYRDRTAGLDQLDALSVELGAARDAKANGAF